MSFDDDALLANRDLYAEEAHGERGIYHPLNGLPREVLCIVDRSPPEPVVGDNVAPLLVVSVQSAGNAVLIGERGILPDEIDTGGDQFEIAIVKGGTAEKRPISNLLGDEGASTTFEVR